MPRAKLPSRTEHLVGSITFWNIHAQYWRERGQLVWASKCEDEGTNLKRELGSNVRYE